MALGDLMASRLVHSSPSPSPSPAAPSAPLPNHHHHNRVTDGLTVANGPEPRNGLEAVEVEKVVGEGAAADEREHFRRLELLIENGFDFLFVVIAFEYMVLVILAFLYYDNSVALGGAAFLLPYFLFMLYLIPNLKSAYIEKCVTNKKLPAGKV